MTPAQFIAKWRAVELKERSASQSHFNDICRLLDIEDPISADPKGEWFTFEKGASKTGSGEGWADVWRKECFAWEYKGKKKDLDRAFAQLQQYAIALDNPPLLIVSDMDRFRIHTNWTNTVQEVREFALEDLLDGATRDLLRACFLDPERLNTLRENWLNPPDLVERMPEVVPGYPDRILPKDEAAAQELKKRTLTNLYNARPAWLDHAHRALDKAVGDAYGWGEDYRAGTLTDDEILARLFRLNQQRGGPAK